MARRIVIFTAGYHARATARHLLRHSDDEVVAFVDNHAASRGRVLFDRPVLPAEKLPSLEFDLVAIPGRHQQTIRRQLIEELAVSPRKLWLVRKSEVAPSLPELERRGLVLADLLRRATTVLEDAGCNYWAMHSALLGLTRGEDLAAFADMDFIVPAANLPMLAPRFADGFNLRPVFDPATQSLQKLVLTADTGDEWLEPAILDFNRVEFTAASAQWFVESQWVALPAHHFAGHNWRDYRKIPVRTPIDSPAVLHALYGPNWSTPAETWNGRYQAPETNVVAEPRVA